MGALRLAVLGPPEAFHEGSRLTFALRKAEALLLYLAVEGGIHPRSKLAALLWPDSAPPAARTALRNALMLLRSLLDNPDASPAPHSHLCHERDLVGLDRHAPCELDLDVVQQAYSAAQRHSTLPPPPPTPICVMGGPWWAGPGPPPASGPSPWCSRPTARPGGPPRPPPSRSAPRWPPSFSRRSPWCAARSWMGSGWGRSPPL